MPDCRKLYPNESQTEGSRAIRAPSNLTFSGPHLASVLQKTQIYTPIGSHLGISANDNFARKQHSNRTLFLRRSIVRGAMAKIDQAEFKRIVSAINDPQAPRPAGLLRRPPISKTRRAADKMFESVLTKAGLD